MVGSKQTGTVGHVAPASSAFQVGVVCCLIIIVGYLARDNTLPLVILDHKCEHVCGVGVVCLCVCVDVCVCLCLSACTDTHFQHLK